MRESPKEDTFHLKKILTVLILIILAVSFYFYYDAALRDFQYAAESKEMLLREHIKLSSTFIHNSAMLGNLYIEQGGVADSELIGMLQYDPGTGSYNLDAAGGTAYEKTSGNLTGIGPIPQSGSERSEINLALQYNRFFHSFYQELPDVAWLYYTSENNFINIYPWTPSEEFSFSEKLKTVDFYTIADPRHNPARESVWTSVYMDEAGKGLMVTLSAPVYAGNTFLGVVSLDMTNSRMSKLLESGYEAYLIDDTNAILAASKTGLPTGSVIKIDEYLKMSSGQLERMKELETDKSSMLGGYYVYAATFDDTPWKLFFRVPVWAVAGKAALWTAPILLVCLLFLWAVRQIFERRKSEALLRQERELMKATLFSINEGIIVTDRSGKVTMMNKVAEYYTGWQNGQAAGHDIQEVFYNLDIATGEKRPNPVRYVLETGKSISSEKYVGLLSQDGTQRYILSSAAGILDDQGHMTGAVLSFRDISTEYEQEKEIDGFLNSNLDISCIFDAEGNFHRVNKKFEEIFGYTSEEVKGRNYIFLVDDSELAVTLDFMKGLNENKLITGFMNKCRCKDGSSRYVEWNAQKGNTAFFFASGRDVTEKVLAEKKLETYAVRDQLTGVYNRNFLDMIIVREIEIADRNKLPLSMILIDLDHFKKVNDTWGHPVGDELLKLTAQTAASSIRNSDILVRFGGEEFIILLPKTPVSGAVAAAEKIRKAIENNRHPVTGRQTASFGVAERTKGESFAHWYQRLDEALYNAKAMGRNRVNAADMYESQGILPVYIEWKKEWECGFKQIDEQHKELIEVANGLIYMSFFNADPDKTMRQMEALIEHCRRHFEYEEKIVARAGYPDYQDHAAIHKGLLDKAYYFGDLCRKGELKSSALLSYIVDDIILLHLVKEDTKFFSYVEKYTDI